KFEYVLLHHYPYLFVMYHILFYQIDMDSDAIARTQILPSAVKFVGSLVVLTAVLFGWGGGKEQFYLAGMSFACFAIFIYTFKPSKVSDLSLRLVIDGFLFIWSEKRRLYDFYSSSILAIVYSLAMLPLAKYYWSGSASSYLGLYMIYWSIINIVITALINNRILPSYSNAIANNDVELERKLLVKVIWTGLSIFAFAAILVIISSFFAEHLWSKYSNIEIFVLFASVPLSIRPLSASFGMLANFHDLIRWKARVQLFVFIVMFLTFALHEPTNIINSILTLLYVVEILLFCCYFALTYKRFYKVLVM
ncbi:hypothetical protein L4D08_19460, partial [Photobacterium chitinilyticum]|uniref:hypothetical protein n=1 Tax=Photobacterium chitinilyticum TaxID=2485123 RepID=UPI003D115861